MESKSQTTFEEIVMPVIKWLGASVNPHTSIIIDATHAEMVQGVQCVNIYVFPSDESRPTSGAVDGGEGSDLQAESTPQANPAPEVLSPPAHHH